MKIPPHYFYDAPTSEESFSFTPSNMLGVTQLLQNKAYWKTAFEQKIKKKKILIFNDASIRKWNIDQCIVGAERLDDLQQEGFTIYILRQNKLMKLDPAEILSPEKVIELAPVSDKLITTEAIEALKVSHNDILILNQEEIRALIKGNNEDWMRFCSSTQVDLCQSNISGHSLRQLLKTKSDIKALYLTNCVNLSDIDDEEPLQEFKLLQLKILGLGNENRSGYSKTKCFALKAELNKNPLYKRSNNLPAQEIQRLLKSAPQLETLNLSGCSQVDLSILNCVQSNTLKNLQLKYLKDSNILDLQVSLNSLETLNVSSSNISSASLNALLKKSPSLKSLDLNCCKNIQDDLNAALNLSALETLNLSWSKINNASLNAIISNASALKSLYLVGCRNINNELISLLNLKTLETLDLSCSSINNVSLNTLLAKASALKSLNLSYCKNITNELNDPMNTNALETIKVNSSSINNDSLTALLMNAHALKVLDLSYCDNLDPSTLHNPIIKKLQTQDKIIGLNTLKFNRNPNLTSTHQTTSEESKVDPSQIRRENKTRGVDATTTPEMNKVFNLERVFYAANESLHPAPNSYRLQSYNALDINSAPCSVAQFATLKNSNDVESTLTRPTNSIAQAKSDLQHTLTSLPAQLTRYYGRKTLALNNEWQSLPSLSPEEWLTDYHLSQPVSIQIAYSTRDNLYYIRNQPGSPLPSAPLTIDFIVNVPQETDVSSLEMSIQKKIKEYQCFKAATLSLPEGPVTGDDYLTALETQKIGACRHRSVLFKAWMTKNYPKTPVRVIYNDCHSFVEVFSDSKQQWITCNLGGYEAQLNIKEMPQEDKPTSMIEAVSLTSEGTLEQHDWVYFHPEKITLDTAQNAKLYAQQLISNEHVSHLIQLSSQEAIASLRQQLQRFCETTKRPCFYVHSPDDLICSADYIQLNKDLTGTLKKGPGGKLHDFLTQHKSDAPLLIINYDQFCANDIVRFNALLDKQRKADGTDLPEKAKVIGLINPNKPGAYNGVDFYSRFSEVSPCSLSEAQLSVFFDVATTDERMNRIKLYGGKSWKEQLLGDWRLQGKNLHFHEGQLIQALKEKKTSIELNNAPWDDEAFCAFWQEVLLHRKIYLYGQCIEVPLDFNITQSQGHDNLRQQGLGITFDASLPPEHVLNLTQLPEYLGRYQFTPRDNTIDYQPGLIEAHKDATLSIYLSHELDKHSWALFLDTCQAHNVLLNLSCAPGVCLADEWGMTNTFVAEPPKTWPNQSTESLAYIQSNDIDATLAMMKKPNPLLIIDISEVILADLLVKLKGELDVEHQCFRFTEEDGILKSRTEHIILKGHFSEELKQGLAEYLLKRSSRTSLWLISDEPTFFPLIPSYQHTVTLEDKHFLLNDNRALTLNPDEPIVRMRAQLSQGKQAWVGLEDLPELSIQTQETIDLTNASAEKEAFDNARVSAVEAALSNAPFVFLAGMTGVGKTSFILNLWKDKSASLYIGESNLLLWATDATPGTKTLFIDEANISSRQWSEFEGLLNTPPGILIGHQYFMLSSEHKVIFAGNPAGYGGERHLPSLFKRHGNSVLFEPMTPAYIYQTILKPALAQYPCESTMIAEPLLKVAQFLLSKSQKSVLISPREITTMALFTASYHTENPLADVSHVAQYYAYTLGKDLLPEEHKAEFEQLFKIPPLSRKPSTNKPNTFLVTPSNQFVMDTLNDYLTLRHHRQESPGNDVQQYGGLGGVILEGAPGIGKTELVTQLLRANGLNEGKANQPYDTSKAIFYRLHVAEKKALLLKAFNEGAIVVIDEINSGPTMERLLNDLLMGKTPDGKAPLKPGFMVIGTQNPVTMAGRGQRSEALKRRMQTLCIPDYTPSEMIDILKRKGVSYAHRQNMVKEYQQWQKKSEIDPSIPMLCFRDLLKRAEKIIKTRFHGIERRFTSTPHFFHQHPYAKAIEAKIKEKIAQEQNPKNTPII